MGEAAFQSVYILGTTTSSCVKVSHTHMQLVCHSRLCYSPLPVCHNRSCWLSVVSCINGATLYKHMQPISSGEVLLSIPCHLLLTDYPEAQGSTANAATMAQVSYCMHVLWHNPTSFNFLVAGCI